MPNLKKMRQTNGVPMPHNGDMLKQLMQERHCTPSQLAQLLGITPSGVLEYQRQPTLHAALLWKIGQLLQHNFFAALSAQHPVAVVTPQELAQQQEIAALKAEMAILHRMLDLVKPGR